MACIASDMPGVSSSKDPINHGMAKFLVLKSIFCILLLSDVMIVVWDSVITQEICQSNEKMPLFFYVYRIINVLIYLSRSVSLTGGRALRNFVSPIEKFGKFLAIYPPCTSDRSLCLLLCYPESD